MQIDTPWEEFSSVDILGIQMALAFCTVYLYLSSHIHLNLTEENSKWLRVMH